MRLELRRFPSSNVFDNGERSKETMTGDATPDEADDAIFALEEDAFAFLEPLVRKIANGESVDQRELSVDAERRLGRLLLSFLNMSSFSFRALCSPTSSLSGSVQTTSHMMEMAPCRQGQVPNRRRPNSKRRTCRFHHKRTGEASCLALLGCSGSNVTERVWYHSSS